MRLDKGASLQAALRPLRADLDGPLQMIHDADLHWIPDAGSADVS